MGQPIRNMDKANILFSPACLVYFHNSIKPMKQWVDVIHCLQNLIVVYHCQSSDKNTSFNQTRQDKVKASQEALNYLDCAL